MSNYNFEETDNKPIKHWTQGVVLEEKAKEQLKNIASLPFIHKHIAAMPDVNWGIHTPGLSESVKHAFRFHL